MFFWHFGEIWFFFLHFWTNLILNFWTNLKNYRYNKTTERKIKKKMFLIEIWTKINFWWRNCNFQSLRGHQNIKKSTVNNNTLTKRSRNRKTYWPFFNFIVPARTIWHDPSIELDLSCSEHFFWTHCDHFRLPNGLICFHVFGHFSISHFGDFGWFLFFIHFCSHLIKIEGDLHLHPLISPEIRQSMTVTDDRWDSGNSQSF